VFIYVVKNASRPKSVIFTGPGREAFSYLCWSHCNSEQAVMQVFSAEYISGAQLSFIPKGIVSNFLLYKPSVLITSSSVTVLGNICKMEN